jgi:DNA-binding NarL/FixJ family response regulator
LATGKDVPLEEPHLYTANLRCHSYVVDFRLRVLAVDDEPLVTALLSDTLRAHGYEVATANSGAEANKLSKTFDPDVALLDVDLGSGPDGIDLASALKFSSPGLAIVFLTNVSEPRLAGKSAKQLPVGSAYLLKSRMGDSQVLVDAIEKAARGKSRQLRDDLVAEHGLRKLSNSQLEVLRLLAAGKSNEEIAQIRGTTVRAVRLILVRAFKVLGIEEQGGSERRVKAALQYFKVAGTPR